MKHWNYQTEWDTAGQYLVSSGGFNYMEENDTSSLGESPIQGVFCNLSI